MSTVVRWVFTEVGTATPQSYTVEINPNEATSPFRRRNTYVSNTSGPGGSPIVQAGRLEVPEIDFSGDILTSTHLSALDTWASKNTVIQITDDLGRNFTGIFTDFTPTRVRRASNFWKHTFTAKFLVTGLKPQGVPTTTATEIFYAKDSFDRQNSGGSYTTYLGNEPLSQQPWTNSTPFANTYHKINYNSLTGQGSLQRFDGTNPTNWYCTSAVPVIYNGDVQVSIKIVFNGTSGNIGVYARSGLASPTVAGDAVTINGGGYIFEVSPSSQALYLSRFGVKQLLQKNLDTVIVPNDTYVLTLRCAGATISAYFYQLTGTQYDPTYLGSRIPTKAVFSVTDTAYANPGYCGVSTYGRQSTAIDITDFDVRSV